jgi:hypothetical protein
MRRTVATDSPIDAVFSNRATVVARPLIVIARSDAAY